MKPFPKPPVYDITIPDDLPPLDGTLSRRARVEIALDVIATLKSRQRKLQLASVYFAPLDYKALPKTGQLHTSRLPTCEACARGILFLKAVDRFDQCEARSGGIAGLVIRQTELQWGHEQVNTIEAAFEGPTDWIPTRYYDPVREFRISFNVGDDRKPLMIAICQNIVDNHGEFKP